MHLPPCGGSQKILTGFSILPSRTRIGLWAATIAYRFPRLFLFDRAEGRKQVQNWQ
jgi:hypothetical protein